MNVVVTGAAGFIGRAVVHRLRSAGMQVTAVSRRPLRDGIRVLDYADTPDGDALVHLAQDSHRARVNDVGTVAETGAKDTLKALLKKSYRRVVYASSAMLYGDSEPTPRRPADQIHIVDTYSRIKRESELAVLASGRGTVARLANLYGPGMSRSNVVSTILAQLSKPGPLQIRDDTPVRDFIWCEDAAAGVSCLLDGAPERVFNFGSGIGVSIRELVETTLELAGQNERQIVATAPQERFSHLVVDISESIAQCSWRPRVSLREGLDKLVHCRFDENT